MKILIKASNPVYSVMRFGHYYWHSACYVPYSIYRAFEGLGHEVKFYGAKPMKKTIDNYEYEIINNHEGYEMMFWRGLESFIFDKEFSIKTLKEFKGIKCISLGVSTRYDIPKYFNYIFPMELDSYVSYYENKFLKSKVIKIPLPSAHCDFIDKDNINPFEYKNNNTFKIVYVGRILPKYLKTLNKLAEKGEAIYMGGTYYGSRPFTKEEIKKDLNPNIKLITLNGRFYYGFHFSFLNYADLGLIFASSSIGNSLNSKVVDYLVCGTPTIIENSCPNAFRIKELNAGQIVNYADFENMYYAIQKEKTIKRNRNLIKTKAREIFDIKKNCNLIIKSICKT